MDRFAEDDMLGVHFALNVFIASVVVWLPFTLFTTLDPIWAMASMVAASEPLPKKGFEMFRSRLINTLVGCAVGMVFLAIGDPRPWKLPFALAVTVLLSSYVVRITTMWRQAPITAAIVISGGIFAHSGMSGLESGLRRMGEVLFGCLVALAVSFVMARLWPVTPHAAEPSAGAPGNGP
jgi:uncharacterized membrane protein YccC